MKLNQKMKLALSISISTIGILGTSLVFVVPNVIPSFPYKILKVGTTVSNANANIQSYNNYAAIDKDEKIKEIQKLLDDAKTNADKASPALSNLNTPVAVDYGSMMIFIEDKATENYLQLLNINFEGLTPTDSSTDDTSTDTKDTDKKDDKAKDSSLQEKNKKIAETPAKTENPVDPTNNISKQDIKGFESKKVTIKLMGPYKRIQDFLQNVPKELGGFNYVDNLKLWKSTETLAKQGLSSTDNDIFQDEKDVIAEFDIITYFKSTNPTDSRNPTDSMNPIDPKNLKDQKASKEAK